MYGINFPYKSTSPYKLYRVKCTRACLRIIDLVPRPHSITISFKAWTKIIACPFFTLYIKICNSYARLAQVPPTLCAERRYASKRTQGCPRMLRTSNKKAQTRNTRNHSANSDGDTLNQPSNGCTTALTSSFCETRKYMIHNAAFVPKSPPPPVKKTSLYAPGARPVKVHTASAAPGSFRHNIHSLQTIAIANCVQDSRALPNESTTWWETKGKAACAPLTEFPLDEQRDVGSTFPSCEVWSRRSSRCVDTADVRTRWNRSGLLDVRATRA